MQLSGTELGWAVLAELVWGWVIWAGSRCGVDAWTLVSRSLHPMELGKEDLEDDCVAEIDTSVSVPSLGFLSTTWDQACPPFTQVSPLPGLGYVQCSVQPPLPSLK